MRCQYNEGNSDQCTSSEIAEVWTLREDAKAPELQKELQMCAAHGMKGSGRAPFQREFAAANYQVTNPPPDKNCITTPDGGCEGGPCMHDEPSAAQVVEDARALQALDDAVKAVPPTPEPPTMTLGVEDEVKATTEPVVVTPAPRSKKRG